MPQTINTNVMSLNAQRNLNRTQTALATSVQRLSSGLRINSAKDDAAGLAISERMSSQIRGLNQAARNANDGISLSQTAEAALAEVGNNLQRIRELAIQSGNASNSDSDRAALQAEVAQLHQEIDRVARQTSYNGRNLLDGTLASQVFQVGANTGEVIALEAVVDTQSNSLGGVTALHSKTDGAAATAFTAIAAGDITIDGGNGAGAIDVGAIALDANAASRAEGVRDAINAIMDQTGVYASIDGSGFVQLNSFEGTGITVALAASATPATTGLVTAASVANTATGFSTLDVSTVVGANNAVAYMDSAITAVNDARATLGAIQNRFESTIANLDTASENLSAARGRIRDADFAAETAELTRTQILQQAGTAMVAQANALPQSVLSLLG